MIYLLITLFVILILYHLLKWKPKKDKWYKNKRWTCLMGHQIHEKNCYVIKNGKKRRGSFKVHGNDVRYIIGWKYKRDKVKKVPKIRCSFRKEKKYIPLQGQGTDEYFIKNYILKIR